MKHIFYTIALFVSILSTAQGQTIVEADLPNVGDIVVEYIDTTNFWNYSIGNGGANQTWDFTQFAINDTGGIYCLAPSAIPWNVPALMPTGEFGIYNVQDSTAAMYASNNTGLYLVGWYNGSTNTPFNLFVPSNGQLLMPVPFSMNSVRNHQTQFQLDGIYIDSTIAPPVSYNVQNKSTYLQKFVADGQGTVITPTGTFNCLRVKELSYKIDSIYVDFAQTGNFILASVSSPHDTTLVYRWVSNGLPCYRFQIELNPQTNQVTKASFFDNDLVFTSLHNTNLSTEGMIYPNPINSGNTFKIQNAEEYNQLLVYDMHGNLVKQESLMSNSVNTIVIDELSNGMYLLKMTGNKSSINQKLFLNR